MISDLNFGIEFECIFDGSHNRQDIVEQVLSLGANSATKDESIDAGVSELGIEIDLGVRPVTPKGLRATVRLLNSLFDCGARVNSSCSSHVHFSAANASFVDNFWFLYWFHKKNGYEVFQQFAGVNQFDDTFASISRMRSTMDEVCEWIDRSRSSDAIDKVLRAYHFLEGEKFNLIRVHPQGTLEWRGFRGLLRNNDRRLVRQSIYTLIPCFARAILKCLDCDSLKICDISLSDFRNRLHARRRHILRRHYEHLDTLEKYPSNHGETLLHEKMSILVFDWPEFTSVIKKASRQRGASIHVDANRVIVHGALFDSVNFTPNRSRFTVTFSECRFLNCEFAAHSIGFRNGIVIEDSSISSSGFFQSNNSDYTEMGLEFGNTLHDCSISKRNNSGIESCVGTHYL